MLENSYFRLSLLTVLLLNITISAHNGTNQCTDSTAHTCQADIENDRRDVFLFPLEKTVDQDIFSVGSNRVFKTDAPSLSEILTHHPAAVSIPFTLSSSFNRTLLYGNTAPFPSLATESGLPLRTWGLNGTDMISNTQLTHLKTGPGPFATVFRQPGQIVVPEVLALWENGVFDENIFNLRFSRPLSRHMTANVFSDYRSFSGTRFNHERNDVIDFYRSLSADTTVLMNSGYNPLVKEHVAGTQVRYSLPSERLYYASIAYGDLRNEFAIDSTAPSSDRLFWGKLNRYIYDIEGGLNIYDLKPFIIGFAARTNRNSSYYNIPDGTMQNATTNTIKRVDTEGSFELGVAIGQNDTAGVRHTKLRRSREFSGHDDDLSYENRPEFFYNRAFMLGPVESYFTGSAGNSFMSTDEDLFSSPYISTALNFGFREQTISVFFKRDALSVYPELQEGYISPYANQYNQTGTELYVSHKNLGMLLGYQYVYGIDIFTVSSSWPQNRAPYTQPNHVFLIAPKLHFDNFSLSARALVSDTKPNLKFSGKASYVFNPRATSAFFESTLALDYWSQRDPIIFAGFDTWSDPIYNLNLTLCAHISTFRLFYKVDNILNRKHSWVPGYFSPGVTFRWGLNWFIQR